MCELWDYQGDDCHIVYKNTRQSSDDEAGRQCQKIRQHVCELWARFMPHAEPTFIKDFRKSPTQRYWEMRLGCSLLTNGFALQPQKVEGPDFLLNLDDKKIWIEATAPTAGKENSADCVPEFLIDGTVQEPPRDKIILRFRTALDAKEKKFRSYAKNGIVGDTDIKIIALSAGDFSYKWRMGDIQPWILSAIFPMGFPYLSVAVETGQIVGQGHNYQAEIYKVNGKPVETRFFTNPVYSHVSAVIYSDANMGNPSSQLGPDLLIIHNPHATSPLPHGLLPCGDEYWVEEKEGKQWLIKKSRAP